MQKITTLQKTYIVAKHSSAKALNFILKKELEELDVEIIDIQFNKERCAEVTIDGEDEIIAKNFIESNYGTKRSVADVNVSDQVYGRFKEVGGVKFGTFVDVGLKTSTKDMDGLYPLFELRNQLANGNNVPLTKILRAYGIIDNLPVFFEITKREILSSKIWLKLTENSLNWLKKPFDHNKEALILCGTTRRTIKHALISSQHTEDIEEIERLGLLEYRLICKKGTRAEGLIPELGPYLGRIKIGAQVVKRVENLLDYNK